MNPLASVFFLSVCCLFGAIESRLVEPKVDGSQVNNTVIVLPTHEDCLLPIERGICSTVFHAAVLFPRFAYDVQTRKCVLFAHTGCFGNANNFETKEECVEKCINYKKNSGPVVAHKVAEGKTEVTGKTKPETHEDCLLPIDRGTCLTAFESTILVARFAYDVETRQCVRFYYTGCSSNANHFETEGDCVEKCINYKKNSGPVVEHKVAEGIMEVTTKTKRPTHEDCLLPIDRGTCLTAFESTILVARFAYDVETRQCVRFYYTGCSSNANHFETEGVCVEKCINYKGNSAPVLDHKVVEGRTETTTKTKRPTHEDCLLPIDRGTCLTAFESTILVARFAYDVETRQCVRFYYTGCSSNANNFETEGDCVEKCINYKGNSAPVLDHKVGEGRTEVTTKTKRPTHEDCLLPIDRGTCLTAFESTILVARFAYDVETRQCVRFYYTGCSSNANHFETKGDCVEKCINYKKNSGPLVEHKVAEARTEVTIKTKRSRHAHCLLPIEPGMCFTGFQTTVLTPRFVYDMETRQCMNFNHTGCFGNANNFETREECVEKCINYKKNSGPVVEHKVAEARTEVTTKTKRGTHVDCLLPIENGTCFTVFHSAVVFPRFAYDVQTHKCVLFTHTGCFGNANNFKTKEECVEKCINYKGNSAVVVMHKMEEGKTEVTATTRTHEDCLQPIQSGICYKGFHSLILFPRFAYDVGNGECVRFYHTGCSGNTNNFKTREECVNICINYKKSSAPTVEHKVADTAKTKRPIHGDCLLTPIVGICTATSHLFPSAETFSYIANRNECAAVLNVGCLHNANSFKTPEDCISKCMN